MPRLYITDKRCSVSLSKRLACTSHLMSRAKGNTRRAISSTRRLASLESGKSILSEAPVKPILLFHFCCDNSTRPLGHRVVLVCKPATRSVSLSSVLPAS
jgi:hypothetical protein